MLVTLFSWWNQFRAKLWVDRLTDNPRGFPTQHELEDAPPFTPGGLNLEQFYPDRKKRAGGSDSGGNGAGGVASPSPGDV